MDIPKDLINEISFYLSSYDLPKLSLIFPSFDFDSEGYWNLRVAKTALPHHDLDLIRSWNIKNKWKTYANLFSCEPGNVIYASGLNRDNPLRSNYVAYHWDFKPIYRDEGIISIQDNYFIKDGNLYELGDIVPYATSVKRIDYDKPLSRLKRSYDHLFAITIDGNLAWIKYDIVSCDFISDVKIVDVDIINTHLLILTSNGTIFTYKVFNFYGDVISRCDGLFGYVMEDKILTMSIMIGDHIFLGFVTFTGKYILYEYIPLGDVLVKINVDVPSENIIFADMYQDIYSNINKDFHVIMTENNIIYPIAKNKFKKPYTKKIKKYLIGETSNMLLDFDGNVYSYGDKKGGCLGRGNKVKNQNKPSPVIGIFSKAIGLSQYRKSNIVLVDHHSSNSLKEKILNLKEYELILVIYNLRLFENARGYNKLGISLEDVAREALLMIIEKDEQLECLMRQPITMNDIKREIYRYYSIDRLRDLAKFKGFNIRLKKNELINVLASS